MEASRGPQPLKFAISEVVALRGLAQAGSAAQLGAAWKAAARDVAGDPVASATRALALKAGVLHIAVFTSPVLAELNSYHKPELLRLMKERHADLKVRDLKFKLRADLKGETG